MAGHGWAPVFQGRSCESLEGRWKERRKIVRVLWLKPVLSRNSSRFDASDFPISEILGNHLQFLMFLE